MSDAFDVDRWRPAGFLPPGDVRDGALIFVVATLCFLACLTALTGLAANRAAHDWSAQLTNQATVIVRPKTGQTPASAAARAAETLAGLPGVSEARALERETAEALIAPWLGDTTDLSDLPIPRLVVVELIPGGPADSRALDRALRAQGLDAVVDDHSGWMEDIRRAAALTRSAGLAVFLLIATCAAAVIAFATRAGLNARHELVELLHLAGAEDRFVAGLFQNRFAGLAALAGLFGAGAAAIMGAMVRLAGGGEGLTPVLPIAWIDLLWLIPCPLLAGLTAAAAARFTALGLVREMA